MQQNGDFERTFVFQSFLQDVVRSLEELKTAMHILSDRALEELLKQGEQKYSWQSTVWEPCYHKHSSFP